MMLILRKILCWCFGFLALMFSAGCVAVIVFLLRRSVHHDWPSNSGIDSHAVLVSIAVMLSVTLIFAMPCGMAWWTIKTHKRFARFWAIAASIEMILMGALQLLVVLPPSTYQRHPANHPVQHFGGFFGLLIAVGIVGIFAFAGRDAMAQPIKPVQQPRIVGDGTSKLLDGIVWVLAVVGYFVAMAQWRHWAVAQQLPTEHIGLLRLLMILLAVTLLHELGHALIGMAIGMKLRAFIVGPFQWRIRDGQWKFQFLLAKSFSAGGATALVPTDPQQSVASQICMIAAGPVVSLWTGLLALYLALMAKGQPYEQYWIYFAYFATIGLLGFATNLMPMRSEAHYSDGAQIYQLLKGGPLADLYRILNLVGSTIVTPLRPRDYDIDAIQRAELSFTQGMQALLLRLFASSYFLDHGMMRQASEAVAEAERIVQESALDLPAELCGALVYRTAFLRRDAAAARQWWERMEAKKPTHFGADYWLAQSALFWIEGRQIEARDAWEKANPLVQSLPAAGDYEFDRYRCALLHDCIEKEVPVAVG
jgi:hypothetical protein